MPRHSDEALRAVQQFMEATAKLKRLGIFDEATANRALRDTRQILEDANRIPIDTGSEDSQDQDADLQDDDATEDGDPCPSCGSLNSQSHSEDCPNADEEDDASEGTDTADLDTANADYPNKTKTNWANLGDGDAPDSAKESLIG